MSAVLSWMVAPPLHASLGDWHGWLSQIAAIAIVGGVWVALAGVAERRGGRGRDGEETGVGVGGGLRRGGGVGPPGVRNPGLRDEAR